MLIGYNKKEKLKLKNTKINMNGKNTTYTTSDNENDFTHYLYMFPSEHSGFRIISKDWVKNVRPANDKDYAELANTLFKEALGKLSPIENETKGYNKAYKELVKQFESIPDDEKRHIVEYYDFIGFIDFNEYPNYTLTFDNVRGLDAGKDYYITIGNSAEVYVLRKNEIDDEHYSVDILEWTGFGGGDDLFRVTYAKNLEDPFAFDHMNIKQITDFEMKSVMGDDDDYEEDEDE
jgi:hypothetical protein